MTEHEAIQDAIRQAGSQAALARAISTTQQTVWKMLHNAKRASAEFVLKIEAATGVSRHDLRPDLYPREPLTLSHPAEATSAETVPAASSPASPAPIGDQAGGGRDNTFKGGVPVT